MFIIIYTFYIICVLYIKKYVLPKKLGVNIDWVRGYKMLFNACWLGTNRQVLDIKMPPRQIVVSGTLCKLDIPRIC